MNIIHRILGRLRFLGDEWYVICQVCDKRYLRDRPRQEQDGPFFVCDSCQRKHDKLMLAEE